MSFNGNIILISKYIYIYTFGYNCVLQKEIEYDNITEGIIYINITYLFERSK